MTKLEEDLNVVRDAGGMGMLFQTLALPEGMAVSSADVIASLNEHLVQALHVSIDRLILLTADSERQPISFKQSVNG